MDAEQYQAIARRNTRLFIAFRLLFNARFYYPVFAVIYLDFGMTLEQFAILNAIWAATIILAEVPSGALSDLIGRKKLLVAAGVFMVTEMCVWAFAPTENRITLFWILAANRVLSGLAEAAASGSDEALAYDALEQAGRKDDWANVLQSVTRWQSFAFIFALILGGIVYDPETMQRVATALGSGAELTQQVTMRFPLYLNIGTAIAALLVTLAMVEPANRHRDPAAASVRGAFAQTWKVARWIARSPMALRIILAGALLDGIVRMFVTMNSKYYRLIDFPEVTFGFIGAGVAIMNYFIAPLSRKLTERHPPVKIFLITSTLALAGFIGASMGIRHFGLVFSYVLFAAFSMTMFGVSFFLNREADQSIRATVLSFKGLAFNLGYGIVGILYALLVQALRTRPDLADNSNAIYQASLAWFPGCFVLGFAALVLFVRIQDGRRTSR